MKQHIQETLAAVLRRKHLIPILVVLVTTAVLTYTILEFSQVWLIALAVPILLYGPIDAVILAGYGIGGGIGSKLQLHKKPVMIAILLITLVSGLGLALFRNLAVVVICLTLITVSLTGITIVFTKLLHDSLQSKIRAGASSAVSSMGRIIIIPIVLLFGYISEKTSVFQASWILVGLILVTSIFALKGYEESN